MADAKKTRTLLIERGKNDRFRIEVPEDWKITFGPLSPRGYSEGNALRLYESDTKQRACFVNVIAFRDISIPVTRLVVSQSGEQTWENDGEGNTVETRKVNRKTSEVSE